MFELVYQLSQNSLGFSTSTADKRDYTEKKATRIPDHIPSADALKRAWTRDWVAGNGMTLSKWFTAALCAWCWTVCGSRPNVDMMSIKKSTDHTISHDQGWACTEFVGGRNKLHGNKRGTRPWAAYYICLCPGGYHQPLPGNLRDVMLPNGNPNGPVRWCTICPINIIDAKRQLSRVANHPSPDLQVFSKWNDGQGCYGQRNVGDVTGLANEWFLAQGALEDNRPYCSNSGRRGLAGWMQATHAPYHEGFEIHGDLYEVWVEYQPNCQKSNFARRTQSRDPHVATAALRRFA